jgi:hypothetical protein
VVEPPVGVPVPFLPKGYKTLTDDQGTYYEYAGVFYEPYYRDGELLYVVTN